MDEHYFRVYLGVTESQIDAEPLKPFGVELEKSSRKMLDSNMYMIQLVHDESHYFQLFFDLDQGGRVTAQRSFLPNVRMEYESLRKQSIPGLGVGYSDGFFIANDKYEKVLFELLSMPNYPTCIMTSL